MDHIWNNKDFVVGKRGGRARVEKSMPFVVRDERGVVLAWCPDEASARRFARAVGGMAVEEVRNG